MKYIFLESRGRYRSYGLDVSKCEYQFLSWRTLIPIFPFLLYRRETVVVSSISHNVYLNFMIRLANKCGLTTVLIVDGIFEYNNSFNNVFLRHFTGKLFRPNYHDFILLTTDSINGKMIEFGGGVVVPVDNSRVWGRAVSVEGRKVECEVLITTANTPYYNEVEYDLLLASISDISKWLQRHDIRFKYRIFDERLRSDLSLEDSENLLSNCFSDVVSDFTHVVSTPSSVGLNIMKSDKALMQLIYRDTPLPFQSGWVYAPGFPLDSVFSSFIQVESERINFQRSVVSSFEGGNIDYVLSSISADNNKKSGSIFFSYLSLIGSEFSFLAKLKQNVKGYLKGRG